MNPAKSGGSLIGKIGSYLQIFTKDPSSTAFVPLAEAYRQIGLLDDALEATRLGTTMLPHFSPGFSTMGRILGQMGRIDEAMTAYARALSMDRQSQAALVGLARLHLVRGERDLAREILRQAAGFHPEDEKITDMLIALDLPRPWAEIKQASQIQPSASRQEAAIEEPIEPIPTATLAEIYVKQGLLDKAINIFQDILKQNPDNDTAHQRIRQLQELAGIADDKSANQQVPSVATPVVSQPATVTQELKPTSVISSEPRSSSDEHSPLTVFMRWLTAIKQGRANVQ
ncbi:MAG: tetratricopeptide repeat protein [Desulfuromonadales bacterium]|nr:tetratricopeptide repeat protein [Desulfuromonadales bacterium]